MQIQKSKRAIALAFLLAVSSLASAPAVRADDDQRMPELPALCQELQVPAGHEVAFRVYAIGVQVYKWNGSGWDFDGPLANLFADANYRGLVGSHYPGPWWESNSGSKVMGRVVKSCTPDPSAISWLRLEAVTSEGPGIFDGVTFIQRVNTAGGLKPTAPGSVVGEEKRELYTTEYYFYRAAN